MSSLHGDDAIEFVTKRDAMLQQALAALTDLESDGLFGPRNDDRFVVICLADSDHPIMLESARRLNTDRVAQIYESEFG